MPYEPLTTVLDNVSRRPSIGFDVNYSMVGNNRPISQVPYDQQFPMMASNYLGTGIADWTENRTQYVKQYKGSTYIAIACFANIAANQPIKFRRKLPEKKSGMSYEPLNYSHPLCQLFEEVNPMDTLWDLIYYTIGWYLLTGDSFLFKAMNGFGTIKQLWPMPSQWVYAVTDQERFISGYKIRSECGYDFTVDKECMVQIKQPNLDWSGNNRYYGHPTPKAAPTTVAIENEMWNRLWMQFKNFAPPGMVFSTEQRLQPNQVRQLWAQLAAQWSHQEATGRPMLLHSGMKLEGEFSKPGSRELDYRGSLDTVLDQTFALYGMPKVLAGIMGDASRSNVEAALVQFVKCRLDSVLKNISQHWTQDIARKFEPDLEVCLGPSAIDSKDTIRKEVETLIKGGAATPDEIRHRLSEMPPLPNGQGSKPVMISGFGQVGEDGSQKTQVGRAALADSNRSSPARVTEDGEEE